MPDESIDAYSIMTAISPGDTPVVFIESAEAGNFNSRNDYIDVNTKVRKQLVRTIWLPFYPATNMGVFSTERKVTYLNRWLDRASTNEGWVVNQINDQQNDLALDSLLESYHVIKESYHGTFKARLYRKITD